MTQSPYSALQNDPAYSVQGSITATLEKAATSVLPQSTTDLPAPNSNFREFLVSGIKREMAFTEEVLREVDDTDNGTRVSRLLNCKTMARFAVHSETKQVKIFSNSCNVRWCPLCIKSKKAVITNSVADWLKEQTKPKFLTLTLAHTVEPLKIQLEKLYYSFRQLRKTKLWKDTITGGIWFFHIKKSTFDNLYHPHLHCVLVGKYLPCQELSVKWQQITGDSKIVDIRAIQDTIKAAREVARYAACPCKLSSFDKYVAVEVVQAFEKRRICGTFGSARGTPLRPLKCEDSEKWIDLDSFFNVVHGLESDDQSKHIWECWIKGEAYKMDMPPPPEVVEQQFHAELEKPRAFSQCFFEYYV